MPEATIALVCWLADFATLVEQWESHHLLLSGRQPVRGGTLSLGKMLSILVLFHISPYKDFNDVWRYGLRHEYRACLGLLPS